MLRPIYPLLLALLTSVMFSCDDTEKIAPTKGLVITIESPKENQRVHGLMTIEASAEGSSKKISMKVYVDGILLKENSGNEISAEVDTKTLTEGTHSIKVTATDKKGNTSEKTINIEVRNILFIVHISSNYVPEFTEIYFALSRNDGTLIAVEPVENGGIITVPTPEDFNPDSTFVFGEYFYLHQPPFEGNLEYLIHSRNFSAGLHAGEYYLPEYPNASVLTGTHHLEITEVPIENYEASIAGTNLWGYSGFFGNSGSIAVDLNMTSNTSDLYFLITEGSNVPVYKYISAINVGESTSFSSAGLQQLQNGSVTTKDMAGSYQYTVSAPSGFNVFSANGNFEDGKIPGYYPSTIYPAYTFYMSYSPGADSYVNRVREGTPPTSFQYLNAHASNVNYSNRKLTVTTTGNFDVVSISGGSSSFEGNLFSLNAYSVTFPFGTKKQIAVPNTPSELSHLEFSSSGTFEFHTAGFSDYLDLSGESEYQNKIVFSSDNVTLQSREFVGEFYPITQTYVVGRSGKRNIALPKELKTILRDRVPQGM